MCKICISINYFIRNYRNSYIYKLTYYKIYIYVYMIENMENLGIIVEKRLIKLYKVIIK